MMTQGGLEMADISQIIEAGRIELFKYFSNRPNVVWKEEDLQSYLYHQILVQEQKLVHEEELMKRLHREFPVIVSYAPRKWAGMLDLAITDESPKNFSLKDVKIDYAIELKFARYWRTGLSPKSLVLFEKECQKDCRKLLTKSLNFKEETKKYFFAFRLTDTPQIAEIKRIFNKIKWMETEYHYIECYTDRSECEVI